jgi:hypothetical protein
MTPLLAWSTLESHLGKQCAERSSFAVAMSDNYSPRLVVGMMVKTSILAVQTI